MEASVLARVACVVLVLCLTVAGGSQYVLLDPASDAVPTNGSVHLSCPSPNATGTFWMRGPPAAGLVPLLGGDPRLVTTGADLWVTSFHAVEHTGLYYCLVAVGNGGSLRSCPATLSHARIQHHFSEEPQDTVVAPGATALLRCGFTDSLPPATIHWKKDGHPIFPDNERVILSPSGYLYLRNVSEEDAGEYRCLAVNGETGKTRRSNVSSLSVNDSLPYPAPRLVSMPEPVLTVAEGGTVVLECSTDSLTAALSWRHTSHLSLPPNSYVLPMGPLVIMNATTSDAGNYICTLISDNGEFIDAAFSSLTVSTAPSVTITGSLTVQENSPLSLVCSVTTTSSQPLTVVWFKESEVIQSSQYSTTGTVMNTLSRNPAHLVNSGLYQCMAYGPSGCNHAVATVTVVETTPPPPIAPVTVQVTLLSGSAQCVVSGDVSSVSIGLWLVDGRIMNTYFSGSDGNGTHIVTSVALGNSGRYTCEVRLATLERFDHSVFYLMPTPPPSDPTDPVQPMPTLSVETTPTSAPPVMSSLPRPTVAPPSPLVTVSVTVFEGVAHCLLQGDLSLVLSGAWLLDGGLHSYFTVPDSASFTHFTSSHLTLPGNYTCSVVLQSNQIVSDSVIFTDPTVGTDATLGTDPTLPTELSASLSPSPSPSTSPSPSPSPSTSPSPSPSQVPPATPSVTVRVQKTSEKANCILSGDLNSITSALWLVHGNDDTLVWNSSFSVVDPEKGYFFAKLSLSFYGTYTCRVVLTGGQTLTGSITHLNPSPSPSPSPPPVTTDPEITVNLIGSHIVCSLSLGRGEVQDLSIFLDTAPLTGDAIFGESTAVLTVARAGYGTYLCVVTTTDGRVLQSSLMVPEPTAPPDYITPPTSLTVEWVVGGDGSLGNILVRWEEPEISEGLIGYKANWDQPALIVQVGQKLLPDDVFEFTISNLDVELPYVVLVWAFSSSADHHPARVELPPLVTRPTQCPEEPCPSPPPPSFTPSPTPPPTTPPPLILADCKAVSPSAAVLQWQINLREEEILTISYSCTSSGTSHTSSFLPATRTSLEDLLPGCHYLVQFNSDSCQFDTPPGPLNAQFNVTEVDGSLVVTWWGLPPELVGGASGDGVKVEVNVSGEWVEVGGANTHTLPHSLPQKHNYTIHLRFSLGEWSSVLAVPVTTPPTVEATPTVITDPTEAPPLSAEEVVLLYGTVIAVVVLACTLAVGVILLLKYVQITRRDTDKVTDHRIYQKEHIRRMSLDKSSLKKTHSHSNGVNGTAGTRRTASRVTNV